MTLFFIRLRLGYNPQKYSSINFVSKISPRPVFFIFGEDDKRVPLNYAKLLFEKAGQPKEIWIVPGAAHAEVYAKAGLEYETKILNFFNDSLKD